MSDSLITVIELTKKLHVGVAVKSLFQVAATDKTQFQNGDKVTFAYRSEHFLNSREYIELTLIFIVAVEGHSRCSSKAG